MSNMGKVTIRGLSMPTRVLSESNRRASIVPKQSNTVLAKETDSGVTHTPEVQVLASPLFNRKEL